MGYAPQHDWRAYEARTAESDAAWLRGLTPGERFALYADMFEMFWNAPRDPAEWERLDRWHWEQKLAMRLRLLDAYKKLDDYRARAAAASSS